jgi:hypothetical protein
MWFGALGGLLALREASAAAASRHNTTISASGAADVYAQFPVCSVGNPHDGLVRCLPSTLGYELTDSRNDVQSPFYETRAAPTMMLHVLAGRCLGNRWQIA